MITEMLPNPVRAKLNRGECSYGIMAFEFFTPGFCQVVAGAGVEFVIFDMEHSGVGIEVIKSQISYARGTGVAPFVRVPGLHYHLIAPVLDAGAMGIMVPMLETQEQAEKLAAWCRYRPEGVRGLAFGISHDDFTGGDLIQKMKKANERTLAIALIETVAGIENIDAIMAVPGIDVGWLGHLDLSNSMGITGQYEAPEYLAAVDRLVAACKRHAKVAGWLAGSAAKAKEFRAKGFRCFCYGTDVSVLQAALSEGIAASKLN